MRRAMILAALALTFAGPTRAAHAAAAEATAAPPCSSRGEVGPAAAMPDLGPEEDQRLIDLPPPLPLSAPAPSESELRRAKCAYLWARVAPWSYSKGLCEFFVAEHERAEIGSEAYWSLVYGYSGSDLKPSMVCRGGGMTALGIMDGTELHLSVAQCRRRFGTANRANSWVSIASHVAQVAGLHRSRGREGWSLMRAVFLPSRPDGARAKREQRRWLAIDSRFRLILAEGDGGKQ